MPGSKHSMTNKGDSRLYNISGILTWNENPQISCFHKMYFVLACLEVIGFFFFFFTESQCTFNIVILLFFVVPRSFPNINYFVRKEATCP